MGSRVRDSLDSAFLISTSFLRNGQGNEGDESHGSDESNEGHEEEAHLRKARQASCFCRQDRQQEEGCQGQVCIRWLARSSCEGPQGSEHQGFLRHQEGHSTLQEGQGALSVSIERSVRG